MTLVSRTVRSQCYDKICYKKLVLPTMESGYESNKNGKNESPETIAINQTRGEGELNLR